MLARHHYTNVLTNVLRRNPDAVYFWGTHTGAELDLFWVVYPGIHAYPLGERIAAIPLSQALVRV